jgi:hypothetical protein
MVSLLASLDHASREVWLYQLSGNFFDQGARLADPMLHLPFFVQMRVFLTDDCWKSFLKEKKMSAKETGTKASPPDKRPKGGKNV